MTQELKWERHQSRDELEGLAKEACSQIEEKQYDAEMKESGIETVMKLGIAFSGKELCIKTS